MMTEQHTKFSVSGMSCQCEYIQRHVEAVTKARLVVSVLVLIKHSVKRYDAASI